MSPYFFVILSLISLSILLYFTYNPIKNCRLISKTMTSICFLLVCLSSFLTNKGDPRYFIPIFIGLAFSLFGDIFLGIERKSNKTSSIMLLLGILSFSLAHISYFIGFTTLKTFNVVTLIVVIIVAFISILTLKSIKRINFNTLFIPVCLYICIISLMGCTAISYVITNGSNTIINLLIGLGAILFMLSDLILSFVLFFKNCHKSMTGLNLLTYYTAQILLALSVLFI